MSNFEYNETFLEAIRPKLPATLGESHELCARLVQDLLSVWDAYSTTYGKGDPVGYFSHACMTAGESATEVLEQLGLGHDQGWGFQLKEEFKDLEY